MLTILWWAFSTEQTLAAFPKRIFGNGWRRSAELHPDKTRLIWRVRAVRRSRHGKRGEGKPETFAFPGLYPLLWATPQERTPSLYMSGSLRRSFTHGCGNSKPSRLSFNAGCMSRMANVGAWIRKVVPGLLLPNTTLFPGTRLSCASLETSRVQAMAECSCSPP